MKRALFKKTTCSNGCSSMSTFTAFTLRRRVCAPNVVVAIDRKPFACLSKKKPLSSRRAYTHRKPAKLVVVARSKSPNRANQDLGHFRVVTTSCHGNKSHKSLRGAA